MSEIREEFFNGYCKNYDMARTGIELTVITEIVLTVKTVK